MRRALLSDLAAALKARDLEAVRHAPKADLHIHAVGGGDRAFLREGTGVDVAWRSTRSVSCSTRACR